MKETVNVAEAGKVEKILRMFKNDSTRPGVASGILAAAQAAIMIMLEDEYPELKEQEDEIISDFARCIRLNLEQMREIQKAENN